MGATTGLTTGINYAGAANDPARVGLLLAAIPNPDVGAGSSGAGAKDPAGANGYRYLDEMSPACAAQLRVELLALQAATS